MIAIISTRFACTEGDLWQKLVEPSSLQYVASPILSFVPAEAGGLIDEWKLGRAYLLNFIPLGTLSGS